MPIYKVFFKYLHIHIHVHIQILSEHTSTSSQATDSCIEACNFVLEHAILYWSMQFCIGACNFVLDLGILYRSMQFCIAACNFALGRKNDFRRYSCIRFVIQSKLNE